MVVWNHYDPIGNGDRCRLRTSLTNLLGPVAIANARLAYQRYLALCRARRGGLASRGAHPNASSGHAPVQEPAL